MQVNKQRKKYAFTKVNIFLTVDIKNPGLLIAPGFKIVLLTLYFKKRQILSFHKDQFRSLILPERSYS